MRVHHPGWAGLCMFWMFTWDQRHVLEQNDDKKKLSTSHYLTLEEMQLLQGKPCICENKTILHIFVLSAWHLFSSSPLTVPAGADNPQTVVQSATDTDSDGWFDPLSYTRSRCCHQFFRAEKCINRRVLQIPLKSPDEDKIHTNMHEHPAHTLGPWALNHEWDQTPTLRGNETSPEKKNMA